MPVARDGLCHPPSRSVSRAAAVGLAAVLTVAPAIGNEFMITFAIPSFLFFLLALSPALAAGGIPDGKSFDECMKLRRGGTPADAQLKAAEAWCRSKHGAPPVASAADGKQVAQAGGKGPAPAGKKAKGKKKGDGRKEAEAEAAALAEREAAEMAAGGELPGTEITTEEAALLTPAPVAEIETVELDEEAGDAEAEAARIERAQKMQAELGPLMERVEQEEKEKIGRARLAEQEKIAQAEQKEREEQIQAGKKEGAEKHKAEQKAAEKRVNAEQKAREERTRAEEKASEERLRVEQKAREDWIRAEQKSNEALGRTVTQYKEKIATRIRHNIVKPPGAAGNMLVKYEVTIQPDGTILKIKLTKASGSAAYDRVVERAIQQSQPFPLPPDPLLFESFRVLHVKVSPTKGARLSIPASPISPVSPLGPASPVSPTSPANLMSPAPAKK